MENKRYLSYNQYIRSRGQDKNNILFTAAIGLLLIAATIYCSTIVF